MIIPNCSLIAQIDVCFIKNYVQLLVCTQVVNHGIPDEVIASIRNDIQKFFQLPLEVKSAYAQLPGDLQGYGQSFVVSESQTLDWSDMFVIIVHPPQARDMRYWPVQPHTFRSVYIHLNFKKNTHYKQFTSN